MCYQNSCSVGSGWASLCRLIPSCFVSHRLFHEHIQRLSKVVTANHKALQVPEVSTLWRVLLSTRPHIHRLVGRRSFRKFDGWTLGLVCRFTWRRPPGPPRSLRSGPSTRTRRHETKCSVYCACAPPSWTSSVWPMKTLSPGRTTSSPCSSLSSSGWVCPSSSVSVKLFSIDQ